MSPQSVGATSPSAPSSSAIPGRSTHSGTGLDVCAVFGVPSGSSMTSASYRRSFAQIIALFAVLFLVLYVAAFLAVFVLRYRSPTLQRPYKALG